MELGQNAPFAGFGKVQVDLGGGNGTVAEKFLDVFDVGPFFQHQGGEGMTKGVRRYVFIDTGTVYIFADQIADCLCGEGRSEFADENVRIGLFDFQPERQIFFKSRYNFHAAQVKKSLLISFPNDTEGVVDGIKVREVQGAKLTDPGTAGKKKL